MRKLRKYTKEEYEHVMFLYSQGFGSKRISKKVGISYNTIEAWIHKGIKPRSAWTAEEKKIDFMRRSKARSNRRHSEETKLKMSLNKLGSKHHQWKGEDALPSTKRKRGNKEARRLYNPPKGYYVHHIDGNTLNNSPNNIMIVTPKEHMIIHGLYDRILKGDLYRGKKHTEDIKRKISAGLLKYHRNKKRV